MKEKEQINMQKQSEGKSNTKTSNKQSDRDNKFRFLDETPRIKGVTGFFHMPFIERWTGTRDGKRNQVCPVADGYTTPLVCNRERHYNSYVDSVYSRVISLEAPGIKRAYRMILELEELLSEASEQVTGDGEEANRMRRRAEADKKQRQARKLEILQELSSERTFILMVDEKLDHHVEAAGNTLYANVSSYWCGVRRTSPVVVDFYPVVETREQPGRLKYMANRDEIIEAIDTTIKRVSGLLDTLQ